MRSIRFATILLLTAFAAVVGLRHLGAAQSVSTAPPPAASNLRILDPQNGTKLSQNFVDVRYELTNRAASASSMPTFRIQLDDRDPVTTDSTDYNFTGLAPGRHTVTVDLVDANNMPISGAHATVEFIVAPPNSPPAPGSPSSRYASSRLQPAALQSSERTLPNTGSALPLLSVVGFGVLIGGIASALKTR